MKSRRRTAEEPVKIEQCLSVRKKTSGFRKKSAEEPMALHGSSVFKGFSNVIY